MSELLAELKALEETSKKVCPAIRAAGELEDREAGEYVLELLGDSDVPVLPIHRILKKEGIAVGRDSLSNHRNQACRCFAKNNG